VNEADWPPGPDLSRLSEAVTTYARYTRTEQRWAEFRAATAPDPDLSRPEHQQAMLTWLNTAGCRIRYPKAGEENVFGTEAGRWWERWGASLPGQGACLVSLDDEQIELASASFGELEKMAAAAGRPPRTLGPTAAAKMLHALRPRALMLWDAAIAQRLHGARGAEAYASHQRLGRAWGQSVLAAAGVDEDGLSQLLGRPGRPLARMLDDFCYLTFTLDGQDAS
jgi:hypothetical protein